MVTLIKNVMLFDGGARPPFKADVLVRDDAILALGIFPNYKADRVINGNDGYLTPGFIDVDAGSDRYLTVFTAPAHRDFVSQGITTILMGHCGFSLAPTLYGKLEHFFNWSRKDAVNVNWRGVGELLGVLEKRPLNVNVATLVGHKVMREDILKNPAEFRKLTANELRVLRSLLAMSLDEGAFGLSSGLGYFPYQDTPYHELRALLDVVHEHRGIYTTHLRNEREQLAQAVEETIKLAQETAVPTIISHLRPFIGFEEEYRKALSLIEGKTAKADVYFDINPFDASAVALDTLLPVALQHRDRGAALECLKDKSVARDVSATLPDIDAKDITILNAPEMEFLNGKTLFEFAQNRGLGTRAALLSLMEVTKLRGVVFYRNLNQEEVDRALFSERALISTNSPSFDDLLTFKPERSYKTFPTFLERATGKMPLEKAVARVTGTPARILGLERRGFVSGGYAADLVLLSRDLAVSMVMVNGVVTVENGKAVEGVRSSGRILRRVASRA